MNCNSKHKNTNNNLHDDEEAGYNKWRLICVEKLQSKLSQNVAKRKKNFEDVVTNAAHKILRDNTLRIIPNPADFKISDRITNEAFDRMCETISAWPGVHLTQCKKLPPIFKKYWRIADNWWNRQKGKWFGDLFFWPILHYDLRVYCKKILINKENQIEYDYLYYIFLCDILHSKVSFKKARPNPLIFDLALEKSPKLQQWFSMAGDQHKVVWEISSKTSKKSIKDYAQSWVKAVKQRKYEIYMRYNSQDISQILNVIPSVNSSHMRDIKHIKRNSDSRKSIRSMSSNSNNSDNNSVSGIDCDSDKDEIISSKYENSNNANAPPKTEQDYKRLQQQCDRISQALAQSQQQQQVMAEKLSQMQFAQYFAQQQYMQNMQQQNYINQQMNEAHLMDAVNKIESMQQEYIKQEQADYNYDISDIMNINQPVFLPQPQQPQRYSTSTRISNPTPEPINILPPPLKTDAGKQRKQSYHDVLSMKGYNPMAHSKDIKPESHSVHSLHTNHSTLTTASHTTVVTDRMHGNGNRQQTPNTIASTPSGSDVSMPNNNQKHFYFGTHGNGYNNQNYGNSYGYVYGGGPQYNHMYNGGHVPQYNAYYNHLPPPVLPAINKPVTPVKQSNLLPPPPNSGSRRQSVISHQSHPSHGSNNSNGNINMNGGMITPPNHSNTNSFEMLNSSFATNDLNDNNYGADVIPFDEEINMNMILNNLSGPNMNMNSNSNLSLKFGVGQGSLNSNPNLSDNMGMFNSIPNNMSISNNALMSMSNIGSDNN